jgi:hypothetical protein
MATMAFAKHPIARRHTCRAARQAVLAQVTVAHPKSRDAPGTVYRSWLMSRRIPFELSETISARPGDLRARLLSVLQELGCERWC